MAKIRNTSDALLSGMSVAPENPTITAGTANTFDNQSSIPQSSEGAPNVPTLSSPTLTPESTISADALSSPTPQVAVPEPMVAPEPTTTVSENVAENTQELIAADTEEAKRVKELREEQQALLGGDSLGTMFTEGLEDQLVPETRQRLQDVMLQLNDLNVQSGVTKERIKGAGGQTLSQAGREVTQEDRENAVRSSGLAAEASILQGNIQTAVSLVNQSVQYAYQDRVFQNQNLSNQINSLQGVVDDQTQQLLDQAQREYEQDNFQISQAVSSVNSAVASGFASADDVAAMTALSGDPVAQKEYADKIIAKSTRTQYLQALAATRSAANAAAAGAATEEQGIAQAKAVTAQTALDVIDVIKNNPLGIKAIAGSSALGRTALSVGFERAKGAFLGGTALGAGVGAGVGLAGGPVTAGAGAVIGGTYGGVTGGISGLGAGTYQASQQRSDVAAGLGFLVNSETFAEMRRLREQGVTFGSLTENERVAIGKSADALFSAMDVDESGAVIGVNTTEENFVRLLNDFQTKQQQYLTEAKRQAAGLTAEDLALINE